MTDQPKSGFDPQSAGGQATPSQQAPATDQQQDDKELSQYLQDEHGHTKESADAEVKRDREGVRRKKKQHEEEHGKRHSSR